MTGELISQLANSGVAAIQYKIRVGVLGEDPASQPIRKLQQEIRVSAEAETLLQRQDDNGHINVYRDVYDKWQGAHWVMAALADLNYPPADKRLKPLRDDLQTQWLAPDYYEEFEATTKASVYRRSGVPVMMGRHRRCASQQANALWAIFKLGLENQQTHDFVERLLHWQWPDGGWNCDKNPDACHSSFMESVLPLRALSLYADRTGNTDTRAAADRAAEVFLDRELYLGKRSGEPIRKEFTALHYPLYWHYDFLHGLKVMAEAGYIRDQRCQKALDLLEEKQLPDGGWPAEKRYYRTGQEPAHGNDDLDWGGAGKRKMNPWVSADALYVLHEAGRI